MKPKEYAVLQARLTILQDKKERQPGSGSSWKDGWRDAILAVKSMLHSEFKADPEWIRVSERLPEKYGIYMVTMYYGCFWAVEPAHFDAKQKLWKRDDLPGSCPINGGVVAWMPWPKPLEEKP